MFNRQTRSATVALTAAFLLAGCVSFGPSRQNNYWR